MSDDSTPFKLQRRFLPEGHYGDPEDPGLDVFRAAELLGCVTTTISNLEERGIIKAEMEPSRSFDGYLKTFRKSVLLGLKERLDCY
jgi:hypothetical protein